VIENASSKSLYMTLNLPTSKQSLGSDMEALAAAGDSGGATLLLINNKFYLAGIHSSITCFSGGPNPPYYGDMEIDVRVSSFVDWIEDAANPPEIPGDYDSNGTVDLADYTLWADSFGLQGDFPADGNGDGIINLADYTIWADNYGRSSN
jgi:hypothetical protein